MNFEMLKCNLDRLSDKALYRQIADFIIDLIKKGRLKVGEPLPSTRQIANQLSMNRNTVVQAFEVLINEGWIISEERRKSYVSDKAQTPQKRIKRVTTISSTKNVQRKLIFFDDGLPDVSCTPMKELARAYRRIFSRKGHLQIMNVSSEFGDEKFRKTISKMLNQNRGMQTTSSEVCITRGSQMALFLTAHCLLNKGDIVLVENPGYRPAWNAFQHAGAQIIPIDIDRDGINVDLIEKVLKRQPVKAIFLTPHQQYPTTITLSIERRLRLMDLSNRYGFTIIEDGYDNEYHFSQHTIMPISSLEGLLNYVYIGTLSKLIAPAIRIGYIVSNPNFINKVGQLRKIIDTQGDTIMEQSILDLILSGEIRKHQKRMLAHYHAKRDWFAGILDHYLADRVTFSKPNGGLAFWLKLNKEVDLFKINEKTNSECVGFHTPDRFSYDTPILGIRLGYASLSEDDLERGIHTLSKYL